MSIILQKTSSVRTRRSIPLEDDDEGEAGAPLAKAKLWLRKEPTWSRYRRRWTADGQRRTCPDLDGAALSDPRNGTL